jgi:hypothetical protein
VPCAAGKNGGSCFLLCASSIAWSRSAASLAPLAGMYRTSSMPVISVPVLNSCRCVCHCRERGGCCDTLLGAVEQRFWLN